MRGSWLSTVLINTSVLNCFSMGLSFLFKLCEWNPFMKCCCEAPTPPPTSGFPMFFKTLTAVWCKIQGWTFRVCVHLGLDLLLFGLGLFPFDFKWSLIFLGKPPGIDGALVCSLIQAKLFRSSCIIPLSDNLCPSVKVPRCAVFRWRKII